MNNLNRQNVLHSLDLLWINLQKAIGTHSFRPWWVQRFLMELCGAEIPKNV